MNQFLTALVGKLPLRLQPYAKGLVPTILALVVILQDLVVSVEEVNELKTLAYGAVASLLVIAFPNLGYYQPRADTTAADGPEAESGWLSDVGAGRPE